MVLPPLFYYPIARMGKNHINEYCILLKIRGMDKKEVESDSSFVEKRIWMNQILQNSKRGTRTIENVSSRINIKERCLDLLPGKFLVV